MTFLHDLLFKLLYVVVFFVIGTLEAHSRGRMNYSARRISR